MTNTPIVNLGEKYLVGLELSRTDDENIAIAAGQARDSTNVWDIVVSSALNADVTINGANGLDTGSVAADTHYALYVIGDSTRHNSAACLLSTSFTSPSLPSGYDVFRRIGAVLTDSSSDFLEFRQQGADKDRWMFYDVAIATDITAGSSATFAAVDMSGGVPNVANTSGMVNLLCLFTPTAADDTLEIRPGSSSASAGYVRASGAVAGVVETTNLVCPYDASTGVDYKVTGSAVALSVAGYMDKL
jgi:hypothetical protein